MDINSLKTKDSFHNYITIKQSDNISPIELLLCDYNGSILYNLNEGCTVSIYDVTSQEIRQSSEEKIVNGVLSFRIKNDLLPYTHKLEVTTFSGMKFPADDDFQIFVSESHNSKLLNIIKSIPTELALKVVTQQVMDRFNTADEKFKAMYEEVSTTLKSYFENLDLFAKKGEISVNDIDKNKGLFDASFFSSAFIEQLNKGVINVTSILDKSVTTEKVADRAIRPENTSFSNSVILSTNLFDKDKVTPNTTINRNNGDLYSPSSSNSLSHYIKVYKGRKYRFYNIGAKVDAIVTEYDLNFNKVTFSDLTSIYTATNDGYIRASVQNSVLNTYMITEGDFISPTFVPYKESTNIKELLVPQLDLDKLTLLKRKSINLFDKRKVVKNFRLNTDGTATSDINNTYYYMQQVEPSTLYSVSEGNVVLQYDESLNLIKSHGTGILSFTTEPNTKYLTYAVRTVKLNDFMLVKGSTLPKSYVGFEEFSISDKYVLEMNDRSKEVNWLALGDSITEGANEYPDRANERLNFNLTNLAVGGTTFAIRKGINESYNPSAFINKVKNDINFSNYNVVTIAYGTNDWSNYVPLGDQESVDESSVKGALNVALKKIYADNPTIDIYLITPAFRKDANTKTNNIGLYLKDYVNAIKEVADKYNITVIDFYSNCGWNDLTIDSYTIGDGLHPNDAGQLKLGGIVYRELIANKKPNNKLNLTIKSIL